MKTPGFLRYIAITGFILFHVSLTMAQNDIPIWKYLRTSSNGEILFMLSDTLGNTYLAGTFESASFRYGNDSVPGITGTQTINTFVLKIDPTGKLIWLYSANGQEMDTKIRPTEMNLSNRGELVIALTAENSSSVLFNDMTLSSDTDQITPIVAKISKTGRINWAYSLLCITDSLPEIQVNDLFIDELGDVYTTGYFRGDTACLHDRTITGLHNDDMLFVAKINTQGEIAWFRNCPYNTEQDNAGIRGTVIKNTPLGYFYLGGVHEGYRSFYFGGDSVYNSLAIDCFLARYLKSDGSAQWARVFRGDSLDYIDDIILTDNNHVVASGLYNSDILSISGHDHLSTNNAYNLVMVEFTETGNYLLSDYYTTQIPFYDPNRKTSYLGRDVDGNLILCSEFYGSSVFIGAYILPNSQTGTSDIMIAGINSNTFIPDWTIQGTGQGDNFIEGARIDDYGNLYLSGTSYTELTIGAEPIAENIIEGTLYLTKILSDGTSEYTYWQFNTPDGLLNIKKITGDGYGNTYVAGNFLGPSSAIDEVDLALTNTSGLFLGKYAFTKNLSGTVRNKDGDIINNGYVKIFGYTLYQRSPLNDSVFLEPDGSYEFVDLPSGNYLMVAYPTETETYVPTYYPSVEYWEFAEHIRITPDSDPGSYDIILQWKEEFSGITELDGNVSEEDEQKNFVKVIPDKGRPTKKASVVLAGNKRPEKSIYEIVSTTETDGEGNFAFFGIEDGDYYLWVDIPGLPCEPVYFIRVNGNQYISNLNYLVDEEVAEAEGFPEYSAIDSPFNDSEVILFPNPSNDMITLLLPLTEEAFADVFDSHGSYVLRFELKRPENRLDISELAPGNYTLRIYYNNVIVFKKFTILR